MRRCLGFLRTTQDVSACCADHFNMRCRRRRRLSKPAVGVRSKPNVLQLIVYQEKAMMKKLSLRLALVGMMIVMLSGTLAASAQGSGMTEVGTPRNQTLIM